MQYSGSSLVIPAYNLALCVGQSVLNPSTQYTATFVTRDLTRYSFTFNTPQSGYTGSSSAGTFDWGYADYVTTWNNYGFLRLRSKLSTALVLDLIYVEVVPGTQANTGHEFVTCLYPADEVKPNTAAVQSDIPINGYTVGGVRPTFPARGDVWFPVNGSRISGCYIYNGRAWEETNARWYTGTRWIPIYAFDIITLEDMWDIADAPETVPSINSEHGFWNWWQKEWLDFRAWLAGIFSGSSGGGGPGGSSGSGGGIWGDVVGGVADGISALVSGVLKILTDILSTLLTLVADLISSIFSFFTDTVLGSIGSFFDSFKDGSVFDFFQPDPEGGGTALPEGVASVFAFFSGVILLLPSELRALLIFGVAALVLVSVFKMVKS